MILTLNLSRPRNFLIDAKDRLLFNAKMSNINFDNVAIYSKNVATLAFLNLLMFLVMYTTMLPIVGVGMGSVIQEINLINFTGGALAI